MEVLLLDDGLLSTCSCFCYEQPILYSLQFQAPPGAPVHTQLLLQTGVVFTLCSSTGAPFTMNLIAA